ncbi:MAG: hypothetical protein Q7T93_16450 [Methylobacterium sp.]|uniref:hypothetical protein n=1 Tax=Methylobacterium sp. TaxID=409 RepID=UPI002717EFE7|nr:hypothetical protein [Methylobacterium sp.]MDO9428408.1 hypothetical protein [Methylobacterium sp.]
MSDTDAARDKLVRTERVKLTATYLNTAAGGLFTTGVVAPLAAAVFGLTGAASGLTALTLGLGTTMFLCASLAMHAAARYVIKGLAP